MRQPIKPELWHIINSTLAEARAAGRAYLESGRYIDQVDAREYRENDQGWPLILADRTFAKGPPNWRSMFSVEPGKLARVLVDDVPALKQATQAALELATEDADVAAGLSYLYGLADDRDRKVFYFKTDFLDIVGDILGRAEALGIGDQDEEALLELYLQVERGRFATELTGDIFIPLVLTAFDTTEPVQLLDGLWLQPMSEELQRARALQWMQSDAVSPHIAAAATHALVLRDRTFPNTMWPPEFKRGAERAPVPLETVDRVLETIHIVTGEKTGYAQVVVQSDAWASWQGWIGDLPHVWRAASIKAYPDDFDGGWLRPKEPISESDVAEIAVAVKTLAASPRNVLLAARRCFRSTFRSDIEDEIIDATIGIEALLSAERDELTHRMSQRAAAVLAGEFRTDAIYGILKQVYAQRSQIVHGSTPKNSKVRVADSEFWTNHIGVFLLRRLLRNYLLADDPWTPASLDALIIERLGCVEAGPEH